MKTVQITFASMGSLSQVLGTLRTLTYAVSTVQVDGVDKSAGTLRTVRLVEARARKLGYTVVKHTHTHSHHHTVVWGDKEAYAHYRLTTASPWNGTPVAPPVAPPAAPEKDSAGRPLFGTPPHADHVADWQGSFGCEATEPLSQLAMPWHVDAVVALKPQYHQPDADVERCENNASFGQHTVRHTQDAYGNPYHQ